MAVPPGRTMAGRRSIRFGGGALSAAVKSSCRQIARARLRIRAVSPGIECAREDDATISNRPRHDNRRPVESANRAPSRAAASSSSAARSPARRKDRGRVVRSGDAPRAFLAAARHRTRSASCRASSTSVPPRRSTNCQSASTSSRRRSSGAPAITTSNRELCDAWTTGGVSPALEEIPREVRITDETWNAGSASSARRMKPAGHEASGFNHRDAAWPRGDHRKHRSAWLSMMRRSPGSGCTRTVSRRAPGEAAMYRSAIVARPSLFQRCSERVSSTPSCSSTATLR